MASIGKYGQINAKVRAMRSNLLGETIFQKLIDASELNEFISSLADTRFAKFFKQTNSDPVSVEYSITLENINQWKHLRKNCTEELSQVINCFIEEYELRKFKHILRLWQQNKSIDTPLLQEKILYEFSVSDIIQSENIHQLIEKVKDIPYQSILVNNLSQYDKMNSVFPFEISLDKDYYARLWDLTNFFDKKDREISRKMLGIEIDLINLEWFIRFKDFYGITAASLTDYLITKGGSMDISFIRSIDKEESAPEVLEKIVGQNRVKQLGDLNYKNKIVFFEKALYSIMLSEAEKAFIGFPFTISILWGYRVFLKFEAKNLFSIIQSKEYQLSKNELLQYLVF
ncbi:MAG: V-type ATPase subunit [bacterium]